MGALLANPQFVALVINIVTLAVQKAPELVAEGQLVIGLLKSGNDPTPEQQNMIRTALANSDSALAKAIADKLATPATTA